MSGETSMLNHTSLQLPEEEFCRHHPEMAFKSSRNQSELSVEDIGTLVHGGGDRTPSAG